MKPKQFLLSAILALFLFQSISYADFLEDIDQASDTYQNDKKKALKTLIQVYQNQPFLSLIKNRLFSKQNYFLYRDFLYEIPLSRESIPEIIEINFLTESYASLSTDISNYLVYYTADSFADRFADFITDEKFSPQFYSNKQSKTIFSIFSKSYIKKEKVRDFDRLLLNTKTLDVSNAIYPDWVKGYLLESSLFLQRDVSEILKMVNLTNDSVLKDLEILSDFINGAYKKIVSENQKNLLFSPSRQALQKKYQIDMPYIVACSYFRESNYSKALEYSEDFYFPEKQDISRFRFLCYLGSGNVLSAKWEILNMQSPEDKAFYSGVMELMENNSNGIMKIENYLAASEKKPDFVLESMLIAFTYYKNKTDLSKVLDEIKKSQLFQAELPALQDESKQNSPAKDFLKYQKAIELSRKNQKEEAKKILLLIISSSESSPLIKNMAVYEYRKTEKP
jgi:hypothetical protein